MTHSQGGQLGSSDFLVGQTAGGSEWSLWSVCLMWLLGTGPWLESGDSGHQEKTPRVCVCTRMHIWAVVEGELRVTA